MFCDSVLFVLFCLLMMSLLKNVDCGAAAGIACPLFQDLSFGLQSSAARNPKKTAAAIPAAEALSPPVSAVSYTHLTLPTN